jgi:hypothetical protein
MFGTPLQDCGNQEKNEGMKHNKAAFSFVLVAATLLAACAPAKAPITTLPTTVLTLTPPSINPAKALSPTTRATPSGSQSPVDIPPAPTEPLISPANDNQVTQTSPATPSPASFPSSKPLSLQSSSGEIRDRLLHPVWNTLWVDGHTYNVYEGETATFFVQAWIDRNGGGRLISSDQLAGMVKQDADISPRFVWASDGAHVRFADLGRQPIYVQEVALPARRHPLAAAESVQFIWMLLPPGPGDYPYFFRPMRAETIAGREALVVESSSDADSLATGRFWVDQLTGVILRSQAIGYDGKTIVHESSVDSIRYNPVLPPAALSLDDFSNVHFEDNPSLIPSPQAPSQPDTVSISVSAPETYTATVPVSETLGMDREAIIWALFDRYLNYYKSEPLHPNARLDDYQIVSVDLDPRLQTMAIIEKRADYVARVYYSVKPVLMIYSNWEAGNGTTHADKWIRDKELIVGVIHTGNIYRLSLIGTG